MGVKTLEKTDAPSKKAQRHQRRITMGIKILEKADTPSKQGRKGNQDSQEGGHLKKILKTLNNFLFEEIYLVIRHGRLE